MKKQLKAIAMIAALALALTLAACGGAAPAPSSAAPEAAPAPAPAPAPAAEPAPAPAPAPEPEAEPEAEQVHIIITNNKGEITAQYAQAIIDFMAAYPHITVEQYTSAVGETINIFDRMTASGETITLAMHEPGRVLEAFTDWGVDLSGERWVAETDAAFKDASGRVIGFPFAIEGFGLVYNQQVVEAATGGPFDPFSINTRDKLIALLDQIKASGVQYPVAYQTEAWSVANHYSSQFINQSDDPFAFVAQLEAGQIDFATNETWNGYYDTMDLLASMDYNKYGERPLGMYYDEAHLSVGTGENAMLFNGNWAFDSLSAVAGDIFGFIPVPVDNNPDNPLNNKLAAGPTQVYMINASASPEQIAAAKLYLDWMVFEEAGQDFVVNKSQVVSAFKNNPHKVTNPLGAAIADAVVNGKTMNFPTNYIVPADFQNILGPDIQRYIDKLITREELAAAFSAYFAS